MNEQKIRRVINQVIAEQLMPGGRLSHLNKGGVAEAVVQVTKSLEERARAQLFRPGDFTLSIKDGKVDIKGTRISDDLYSGPAAAEVTGSATVAAGLKADGEISGSGGNWKLTKSRFTYRQTEADELSLGDLAWEGGSGSDTVTGSFTVTKEQASKLVGVPATFRVEKNGSLYAAPAEAQPHDGGLVGKPTDAILAIAGENSALVNVAYGRDGSITKTYESGSQFVFAKKGHLHCHLFKGNMNFKIFHENGTLNYSFLDGRTKIYDKDGVLRTSLGPV